jgi:adenine-specific DNA methylase
LSRIVFDYKAGLNIKKGVTGLRGYNRSNYCKKAKVVQSFEDLIKNAKFKYIFFNSKTAGFKDSDFCADFFKCFRYAPYTEAVFATLSALSNNEASKK